jgi:SsrA-binding protein
MAADEKPRKLIAENRRARFDYFLESFFEAGLALTGSEVKSLRNGRANIAESYAAVEGDEIMLVNADIPLKLFWNDRGLAKLEVALAKGKKEHDKREATAERDWQRDKARLMKDHS